MNSHYEQLMPRWCSPPGETIRREMTSRNWSLEVLASKLAMPKSILLGLMEGTERVTIGTAKKLAGALGGSTGFWMNRDARYLHLLDCLEADHWVSQLPHKELDALGWLSCYEDWYQNLVACMDFFDVDNPLDLRASSVRVSTAHHRARPTSVEHETVIAAWVRQVERIADMYDHSRWDPDGLLQSISSITALSRISHPQQFIPQLQHLCSRFGLTVVFVRPPTRCPISGVALTTADGHRIIGLSGRYLADDHLWFTLLHEIGHLILHDDGQMYIDEISNDSIQPSTGREAEADEFASNNLVPRDVLDSLGRDPNPTAIHGVAHRNQVSNGIVVGQLQHYGLLPYRSRLNRMKRRYKWEGSKLSRGSG